jgi:hypothetical protein
VDRGARTPGELSEILHGRAPAGTLDPAITSITLPVFV